MGSLMGVLHDTSERIRPTRAAARAQPRFGLLGGASRCSALLFLWPAGEAYT